MTLCSSGEGGWEDMESHKLWMEKSKSVWFSLRS